MDDIQTHGVSKAALAVCAKHYGKLGSGCGRCPIHRECTSECRPGEEGLREWREKCDAAAKAALAASECV